MSPVRQPEETRSKILHTALELFHAHSYSSTSVNQIVEEAGITKGALFHHFKGKNELAYAIVDELLIREIEENWAKPLANSIDPATDIMSVLKGFGESARENPNEIACGCPINNLAQELSNSDETMRLKLKRIIELWQDALRDALLRGIEAGNVRKDIDAEATAATMVALFEGCIGTLKVHHDIAHLERLSIGCHAFLESLRP